MKTIILLTVSSLIGFTVVHAQPHFQCPPEGSGKPVKGADNKITHKKIEPREQNLNTHKNRAVNPNDFDGTVTTEKMIDSKDDSIFSADNAAQIEGYLFKAQPEAKESCNCYTDDKTQYDTHVYLSPKQITSSTSIADCVVIEITPYTRQLHPGWNADYINTNFAGKHVTVKGWLLYDYWHLPVSAASHPGKSGMERATVWEIHPITDIIIE